MSLKTIAAATYLVLQNRKSNHEKRKRRFWSRYLFNGRESVQVDFLAGLTGEDGSFFLNFTRMNKSTFDLLLGKVDHLISKQDTYCRPAISSKVRLLITLRFLASGDSYKSLMYLFKVSSSTISLIIPEVCSAIIHVLKPMIKVCIQH